MDKVHKDLLRSKHVYLVEQLEFKNNEVFTATLIEEQIISADDLERLQICGTSRAMASEFLLQILPRRGPDAFKLFIKCLVRSGKKFVADELDLTLSDEFARSLGI